MKRKVMGWLLLLLPVLCLVLELLPWGTVAVYAHPLQDGTIETVRRYFSYFHYTGHGLGFASGDFGTFFAPVVTVLLLLFALRYFFTGRGRAGVVACAALGAAAAVTPVFIALYLSRPLFDVITPIGLVMAALFLVEGVLALLIEPLQKKRKK